jgi:hypothetical protein
LVDAAGFSARKHHRDASKTMNDDRPPACEDKERKKNSAAAGDHCCYSIPRPQRYFLIYFHSLANNRTSVNFFY